MTGANNSIELLIAFVSFKIIEKFLRLILYHIGVIENLFGNETHAIDDRHH